MQLFQVLTIFLILASVTSTPPALPFSFPSKHHHERLLDYDAEISHPRDVLINFLLERWIQNLQPNSLSRSKGLESRTNLRRLGDFDDLNALFDGTIFALPDFYIPVGKALGATLNVWATDIECSGIRIDDLNLSYVKKGNSELRFKIDIENLDISCDLDWRYKWSFFSGKGRASIESGNNDASATITFESEDFDKHPPNKSYVSGCDADIGIDDLSFRGGIVNSILNLFEGAIKKEVEKEIDDVVCEELGTLGTGLVEDMLQFLDDFLESYLGSSLPAYLEAYLTENNFSVPPDVQLLDLFSSESKVNGIVKGTLKNIDKMFGAVQPDSSSPSGTGEDLGINKFLRSTLLDEYRSYVLDVSDWPESISNNGIIFQGHDMLTETVIELTEVKIIGLDTFSFFDPLNNVGNHTLSNHLFWDFLTIQLDLEIKIKPSTLEDSLIAVPSTAEINEKIQINFGVKDVDVDIYLLLAIEEDKAGNIELGSIVNGTNFFNCIVESLFIAEVTGLSLSVSDIIPPTLTGFVSVGIDQMVTTAVDAAFDMYEATFIKALPNLFQSIVRELFNKSIRKILTPSDDCESTPESKLKPGFVNFPDLLLSPDDATQAGGTGMSQYGSNFRQAMDIVLDQFAVNTSDDTSPINTFFISPFTKKQSGIEGTLHFHDVLFDIKNMTNVDILPSNFDLKIYETKVENMNTIGSPINLFEPIAPQILNNTMGIGKYSAKPLRGSLQLLFEYRNDGEIQMSNLLEVGLELYDTSINLETLIALSEANFLQFPIRSMSNFNCWLSLIPTASEGLNKTLALEALGISSSKIRLTADCVACSTPELNQLSEFLSFPNIEEEVNNMVTLLFDYMSDGGRDVIQPPLNNILSKAHMDDSCPGNKQITNSNVQAFNETFDPNVNFGLSNIQCSRINVDEIKIVYNQIDEKIFDLNLEVSGFDVQCNFDWNYNAWLFDGSGTLGFDLSNSNSSTTISFLSENFTSQPPNSALVTMCNLGVEIDDINIEGGLVGGLLQILLEGNTKDVAEDLLNSIGCDQLSPLGSQFMSNILEYVDNIFQTYLEPASTALEDAQNAEKNLMIPSDVQLVDLFSDNTFKSIQDTIQEMVGGIVSDPNSPTGNGEDLGINKFLRSLLLDENREFVFDVSELFSSFSNDGVIYKGKILQMETAIELNRVKIFGIDTFKLFDPLNSVGNYTIMNNFQLEHLNIELDLNITSKPSPDSDGFILAEFHEEITVSFGLKDINFDLFLLIAIEEYKLGNIELGTIMNTTMALNCLFDSLFVSDVTGLYLSISDIIPPTIRGLSSPMMDDAFNGAIKASFEMYEVAFLLAFPNLFHTTIRDLLNNMISELHNSFDNGCSQPSHSNYDSINMTDFSYINLPDLLLLSEEAVTIGGTGRSQYGSILPNVVKGFLNQLKDTSGVNDLLISPLTKSQSGIAGTLVFDGNLFDMAKSMSGEDYEANILVQVSNTKFEHVDSIGEPLNLLHPIAPLILNNTVGVGKVDNQPVRGSMQLLFEYGNNGDIQMSNLLEVGLELYDTVINLEALIALSEVNLLQFPVQYMTNLNCWLSLIPTASEGLSKTLALEALGIFPSKISLTADCVACSTPEWNQLSEFLSFPNIEEEVNEMATLLFDYISDEAGRDMMQGPLDRMLSKAHMDDNCPGNNATVISRKVQTLNQDFFPNLDVNFGLSNIQCSRINVDEIQVVYNKVDHAILDLNLFVKGLDIQCDFDWNYNAWLFDGSGTLGFDLSNSNSSTTLSFLSENFTSQPPNAVSISQCNLGVNLADINIEGGLVGGLLQILLEGNTKDVVEDLLNGIGCGELSPLGSQFMSDILEYVDTLFQSYLEPTSTALENAQNAEKNLMIPTDVKLVNLFSNVLFESIRDSVHGLVTEFVSDPSSPTGTGKDLSINKFLRSLLLDENRDFLIEASNLPNSIINDGIVFDGEIFQMKTVVELRRVKIFGIDTFTSIDFLNIVGSHTSMNNFQLEYLNIEIDLRIRIKPSSDSEGFIFTEFEEDIQVSFGLKDIGFNLFLLIAIEEYKLGNIELGKLMTGTEGLNLLFNSLFVSDIITGLSLTVSDVIPPTITGFTSPMIDNVFNEAIEAVFEMYETVSLLAMPNLFQTTIRDLLNNMISDLGNSFENGSLLMSQSTTKSDKMETLKSLNMPDFNFVNMPDFLLPSEEAVTVGGTGMDQYGIVIPTVLNFLLDRLKGAFDLNDILISPITESQSGIAGTLAFDGNLFDVKQRLSIDEFRAELVLKGSDAKIENLDSIGNPIKLLNPVAPLMLNNTIGVGSGGKPLRASMQFHFAMENDDIAFNNIINIGVELENTLIYMVTLIALSEASLRQFEIQNMSNLNCWLSLIPAPRLDSKGVRIDGSDKTLALEAINIALSNVRFNVDCISCSSPDIEVLSELLKLPENQEEVTQMASGVLDYLSEQLGGSFLQVQLDRMLSQVHSQCPQFMPEIGTAESKVSYEAFNYPEKPSDNISIVIATGATVVALALFILIVTVSLQHIRHKRHLHWLETLDVNEILALSREEERKIERQKKLNKHTKAIIFSSSAVPLTVRILIPIVIIVNILLFLSGHLSLGASVNVHVSLAGQTFIIKNFFIFSMLESVIEMWEAGAKPLAVLIIIFSGLWPYTKQLTILFLWLVPPTWVSVSRRESIFLWLDALGKWSFVDIFVLIMSIVSFRVSVNSPDMSFFPSELYSINLLVVPQRGLYSNMSAQIVSQISSHIIIYYHRKIISVFDQREWERDHIECALECTDNASFEQPRALHEHAFDRVGVKKGNILRLYPFVNKFLILFALTTVAMIICGCTLPSFKMEVLGLIGLAVEAGQSLKDATSSYNIFSVIGLIFDQASFLNNKSDYFGLACLSMCLIFTVLIVPLLQVILLMVVWFKPLTRQMRSRLFVVIEALQAWQYIEVYILAVVVATWQLGGVSQFMINAYCGGLEDMFASLLYYGFLKEADAQCFRVNADVSEGIWICFLTACMLALLNHFITKAASQQERDIKGTVSFESDCKDSSLIEAELYEVKKRTGKQSIPPTPLLFTDFYRWLLCSDQSLDRGSVFTDNAGQKRGEDNEETLELKRFKIVAKLREFVSSKNIRNSKRTIHTAEENVLSCNDGVNA